MPDLILISATGGDSAMTLYDQLSTIAPTLIINYDDKSWQALLTQLGRLPATKNRRRRESRSLIKASGAERENEAAAAAGHRAGLYRRGP